MHTNKKVLLTDQRLLQTKTNCYSFIKSELNKRMIFKSDVIQRILICLCELNTQKIENILFDVFQRVAESKIPFTFIK